MPIIDDGYIQALKMQLREQAGSTEDGRQPDGDHPVVDKHAPLCSEKAFKRIVRWSATRDRAVSDIRKRLSGEAFPDEAIEEALERACRCGLVDDARFAESLARTRIAAGMGKRGIEAELARLDIEPSMVPGWPEEFLSTEDEEIERAVALLKRKPPTAKNKRDAAYRKLIGKGYSSSIATTAARLWMENLE